MKPKSVALLLCVISSLAAAVNGRAQLLYRTALADVSQSPSWGYSVLRCAWPSFRFHLSGTAEVTGIGATMAGVAPEGFFVVIVPLPAPDALPEGGPGESVSDNGDSGNHLGNWNKPFSPHEVLAVTYPQFTALIPEDLVFPLNVTLPAGDYGVVFGLDLDRNASEPNLLLVAGYEQAPGSSYFWWSCTIWRDGGIDGLNCSVFGSLIP